MTEVISERKNYCFYGIWGLAIHLLVLYAVFDVNFHSPVRQIPANRVLTSGDTYNKPHWHEQEPHDAVDTIQKLLQENKIEEALKIADSTIESSKSALYHYRQLQRNQLIIYLTLLWIGWIVLLILKLIGSKREGLDERNKSKSPPILANAVFAISVFLLIIEHSVSERRDWRVLGYGVASFFSIFLACRRSLTHTIKFERISNFPSKTSFFWTILLIAVMSARIIHDYYFIIFAVLMSVLMSNHRLLGRSFPLAVTICSLMSATTKSETEKITILEVTRLPLFIVMPFILPGLPRKFRAMETIRQILIVLIMAGAIDGRNGLSWIILITTPLCILMYPKENQELKLSGVIYGLVCPLILLSDSIEPETFCCFGADLIANLEDEEEKDEEKEEEKEEEEKTEEKDEEGGEENEEKKAEKEEISTITRKNRRLTLQDVITAVYFIFYIILSFFGPKNTASITISLFDPIWTRHFITGFTPFTMTIFILLILIKLAFPLILIGYASRAPSKAFLAFLVIADCTLLPLLMYSVISGGNWLDIGNIISAVSGYTITITLLCLFLVIYSICGPLMRFSSTTDDDNLEKQHFE